MNRIRYTGVIPGQQCCICGETRSVKYRDLSGKYYCNMCALKQMLRDSVLEDMWRRFADVPMNPETECIEEDWHIFPAGTNRMEIWHWFDERHSGGVYYLLYEMKG